MREIAGVLYINDGDWVESCTAVVEHHDGRMEILDWSRRKLGQGVALGISTDREVIAA